MSDEQRAVAIHEAGHAVMAWACEVETSFVELRKTAEGEGATTYKFNAEQKRLLVVADVEMCRRIVLICCGGLAAAWAILGTTGGGGKDQEQAREYMLMIRDSGDNIFNAYLQTAMKFFEATN